MRQISSAMFILPALWLQTAASTVTLTETNNLSITGEISSYSPKTGLVKINQYGNISTRPLSAFTEESLETIILWRADKNFERKSNLDVTATPHYTDSVSNTVTTVTNPVTKLKQEFFTYKETHTICTYKISIRNESDTPFKNLTADYRIFFTHRLTEKDYGQYQLAGQVKHDELAPETTWSFETNPFDSAIDYWALPGKLRPYCTGSNVLGILLRIRKPGLTEEWLEQEIEIGELPRSRERSEYQKIYK